MWFTLHLPNLDAQCFCASPIVKLMSRWTPSRCDYVHPCKATVGPVIASVKRRFSKTMRLRHSFPFVDVHVDEYNDSDVWLVRTCSQWKCRRGPLPGARTWLPWSRVQLRGPTHFSGEPCARKGSISETDCQKQRFVQGVFRAWDRSCFRHHLFKLRNWAPFCILSGAPRYALHCEIPHELPVYYGISYIPLGIDFYAFWSVFIQREGTKVSISNLVLFSGSQ